ncbi:GPI mannosyltransferase 2 [Anabrus simplex]|uniref:GPI mannosyltransferase 2 n=1 Tax=Anabrus simplex TaxID=316456 RepID=UPI0035A2FE51
MLTLRDKVWWFALSSRLFVVTASSAFNFLLPDHAADAFVSPHSIDKQEESFGDVVVRLLFGGLIRWDAQYFMHIALYGYTYENCLAFFPLFPLVVRLLAGILSFILYIFFSQYSIYVLSAVLINVVCFVKSAVVLHDLSLQVLKDSHLAYIAALFYCINPASIFFTAPYSETLFALLSFYGMLMCSKGLIMNCGIPFGLAATARSNGIVNIGFICYYEVKRIINFVVPRLLKETGELRVPFLLMIPMLVVAVVVNLFPCVVAVVLALMPFIGFQAYSYYKFCVPHSHNLPTFLVTYADTHGLILPGSNLSTPKTHWCKAQLPLSYSYIQDHYWDVGFLKYYEWKQIPNFLLAFPVIFIVFVYSYRFLKYNLNVCLTLGLTNQKLDKRRIEDFIFSTDTFVYVAHVVFLTIFSVLFINIQVTTRLISSASPVLYWFVASLYTVENSGASQSLRKHLTKREYVEHLDNMYIPWKTVVITHLAEQKKARLVQYYFLTYFLLGTAMFSNFYPWT